MIISVRIQRINVGFHGQEILKVRIRLKRGGGVCAPWVFFSRWSVFVHFMQAIRGRRCYSLTASLRSQPLLSLSPLWSIQVLPKFVSRASSSHPKLKPWECSTLTACFMLPSTAPSIRHGDLVAKRRGQKGREDGRQQLQRPPKETLALGEQR